MFGLGTHELIIILFIAFLIFGAKRLPEIGGSLGKAIKEFRRSSKEITEEQKDNIQPGADKAKENKNQKKL
ncbi:MAG TPA: twin-arginine translocase TatA/TatE family subunit [Syntrophaceae bacterium]|nr:twin-arginine translocase TatA/TatE family subunit [Syntrophaceae bacterium]